MDRDYIIFTDSCVDLDPKMVEELGIEVQNLTFTMDGHVYSNWLDGREMPFEDFYDKLRSGSMSSTSQVNATEFISAFKPFLQQGKDILYLAFSSGLSSTADSAFIAAEDLMAEFEGRRVIVVDTLAASLGQGLLVYNAVQFANEGKTIDEVAEYVEKNKLKLAHWFTVDDLGFLRRGGRVSAASAFFGSMLSIKPVLHVDNEGHLIAMERVRGRKNSLDTLVSHVEKTGITPAEQTIFISHGDCLEDAKYVAKELKNRLGVKNTYINYIGPVIGSHSGPGTMAIFYTAIER